MADKRLDGDVEVNFTEAASRQSLESGESVKTLFGKLRKWLSDLKPVAFSGSYNDLTNKPTLGTAAAKDVASSGNASTTQVVMGNDTRLSDSRPASDVSSWAKASTKPTYTASEVGAAPASHTQASSTITAMTGYTKPSSTSAITASDTLNQAIGKLEKGLESSGGGTGLLKCYSSNTYSKIKITFKQSSFSYMFFVQGFTTGWQGDGLSIVGGKETGGKCFHIASTTEIENVNVTIDNKIITVNTGYIRALYIPAEVIKQASLVQISDSSGYDWITIYSS